MDQNKKAKYGSKQISKIWVKAKKNHSKKSKKYLRGAALLLVFGPKKDEYIKNIN